MMNVDMSQKRGNYLHFFFELADDQGGLGTALAVCLACTDPDSDDLLREDSFFKTENFNSPESQPGMRKSKDWDPRHSTDDDAKRSLRDEKTSSAGDLSKKRPSSRHSLRASASRTTTRRSITGLTAVKGPLKSGTRRVSTPSSSVTELKQLRGSASRLSKDSKSSVASHGKRHTLTDKSSNASLASTHSSRHSVRSSASKTTTSSAKLQTPSGRRLPSRSMDSIRTGRRDSTRRKDPWDDNLSRVSATSARSSRVSLTAREQSILLSKSKLSNSKILDGAKKSNDGTNTKSPRTNSGPKANPVRSSVVREAKNSIQGNKQSNTVAQSKQKQSSVKKAPNRASDLIRVPRDSRLSTNNSTANSISVDYIRAGALQSSPALNVSSKPDVTKQRPSTIKSGETKGAASSNLPRASQQSASFKSNTGRPSNAQRISQVPALGPKVENIPTSNKQTGNEEKSKQRSPSGQVAKKPVDSKKVPDSQDIPENTQKGNPPEDENTKKETGLNDEPSAQPEKVVPKQSAEKRVTKKKTGSKTTSSPPTSIGSATDLVEKGKLLETASRVSAISETSVIKSTEVKSRRDSPQAGRKNEKKSSQNNKQSNTLIENTTSKMTVRDTSPVTSIHSTKYLMEKDKFPSEDRKDSDISPTQSTVDPMIANKPEKKNRSSTLKKSDETKKKSLVSNKTARKESESCSYVPEVVKHPTKSLDKERMDTKESQDKKPNARQEEEMQLQDGVLVESAEMSEAEVLADQSTK